MSVNLVEGWTDPINDQLLIDGVATESLAGHTVECILYNNRGILQTGMGTSEIVDAATRKVKFTPGAGKLLNADSPYTQRWKITRPTAQIYYHPNAGSETWNVRKI